VETHYSISSTTQAFSKYRHNERHTWQTSSSKN
jgi:hypothetical protein